MIPPPPPPPARPVDRFRDGENGSVYRPYLASLLEGDRQACRTAVERLLEKQTPLRELYEGLFQRALYDVGELWERGRISVATEHLATAITESLMTLVYPRLFAAPHVGRSAVVSCVANEFHQVGGKMVADTFELHGWNGYFVGANTPVRDLLELIDEKKPDVVAMSLTVYFGIDALRKAAEAVRAEFPDTPIWVGGQAFRWGGCDRLKTIPDVDYMPSLGVLEQTLATWSPRHA